jgi:hypothetical protein
MEELVIFGIIQFITAVLSGASGGGGGLIIAPFMVLLGLSPASAIATAKFGGFGLAIGTSSRFYGEKITAKRTIIIFSILGGIGAIAGSLLLVGLSNQQELLQRAMGLVILFVGIPLLYARNLGLESKVRSKSIKLIGLILLTISVMFQAALGSGVGVVQMTIFMWFFGMTALVASATRRAMQLTVASISLIVFIAAGLVDYRFGLVSFGMALIGGYIGANIAIKKGNKFVVNILSVTSAILAVYLIFG